MIVRLLAVNDVDDVVERARRRLAFDATREPLLSPVFASLAFARALASVADQTWVAVEGERVVGHLHGALLENTEHGRGAWISPDGVSFDDAHVLVALYAAAGAHWIEGGALEHYAWVFDDDADRAPWLELGFAPVHQRGVLALRPRTPRRLPAGYTLRRGGPQDLEPALELDRVIDDAQGPESSTASGLDEATRRLEMLETLEDDDVHHYVVEYLGGVVAQCLTFPLDARRGSFDQTVHLSAVAVQPVHQGRGVATALVDYALAAAFEAGFHYVETNWRVTNERASTFWPRYGFRSTYVRLRRTVGVVS